MIQEEEKGDKEQAYDVMRCDAMQCVGDIMADSMMARVRVPNCD